MNTNFCKIITVLLTVMIIIGSNSGCGNSDDELQNTSIKTDDQSNSLDNSNDEELTQAERVAADGDYLEDTVDGYSSDMSTEAVASSVSGSDNDGSSEAETSFSFSTLAGYTFEFATGAGAWHTSLAVYEDGTFAGVCSDWDAYGVAKDGTEWNGQYYWSCFNGKFTNLAQIDDTTWSAEIEYLEKESQVGTEEIWGTTLYLSGDPYGLDDIETVYFYLPETKVADLPDESLNWGYTTQTSEIDPDEQFGKYGIYNVSGAEGFVSYYTDNFGLVYYDVRVSTENDCVLPESSTRVYTDDELSELTANQLLIARNEIYARHHYIFDDEDLKAYFNSCAWYFGMAPSAEFDESVLSDIEKENIEAINNVFTKAVKKA